VVPARRHRRRKLPCRRPMAQITSQPRPSAPVSPPRRARAGEGGGPRGGASEALAAMAPTAEVDCREVVAHLTGGRAARALVAESELAENGSAPALDRALAACRRAARRQHKRAIVEASRRDLQRPRARPEIHRRQRRAHVAAPRAPLTASSRVARGALRACAGTRTGAGQRGWAHTLGRRHDWCRPRRPAAPRSSIQSTCTRGR
jgi:hypothetical protein